MWRDHRPLANLLPGRILGPAAVVLIGLAVRLPGLQRPGLSTDEEFIGFAVDGIGQHGLPVLPSGLVYERGLLYTYLCKLAALLVGPGLGTFRAISLAAGVLTIVAVYRLGRSFSGSTAAGTLAAVVVALSPLHAQLSTWARFYALFILFHVWATHWSLTSLERRTSPWRGLGLALACRLSHELAWSLLLIPAAAWLAPSRVDAGRRARLAASLAIGLTLAEALLLGVSLANPHSPGASAMIGSTVLATVLLPPTHLTNLLPAWLLAAILALALTGLVATTVRRDRRTRASLAILTCAGLVQFTAALVMAGTSVMRGALTRRDAVLVSLLGIMSAVIAWTAGLHALGGTPFSWVVWLSVLEQGFAYGTSGVWQTWSGYPFTVALVALGVAFTPRREAAVGTRARTLAVVVMLWAVLLGVTNHSFEPRYLAVPLLATWLIAANLTSAATPRIAAVLSVLVIGAIGADEVRARRVSGGDADSTAPHGGVWQLGARPLDGLDTVRAAIQSADEVICDDELLARLFVGRCDVVFDAALGSRNVVRVDGIPRGRLGGAPALRSATEVADRAARDERRRTWIILTGSGGFAPESAASLIPYMEARGCRASLYPTAAGASVLTSVCRAAVPPRA